MIPLTDGEWQVLSQLKLLTLVTRSFRTKIKRKGKKPFSPNFNTEDEINATR